MMGCSKCYMIGGAAFLVLGLAFLGKDLGWWGLWDINWWTAAFIVWGVGALGSSNCPDCKAVRGEMKKK